MSFFYDFLVQGPKIIEKWRQKGTIYSRGNDPKSHKITLRASRWAQEVPNGDPTRPNGAQRGPHEAPKAQFFFTFLDKVTVILKGTPYPSNWSRVGGENCSHPLSGDSASAGVRGLAPLWRQGRENYILGYFFMQPNRQGNTWETYIFRCSPVGKETLGKTTFSDTFVCSPVEAP